MSKIVVEVLFIQKLQQRTPIVYKRDKNFHFRVCPSKLNHSI
jgi:hypothetical protein